jgi:AcrR family transcriptional regulator
MTDRDTKMRILEAAIPLFAQKGYAAVGVRELAAQANVNLAMISYYFDGKVGVLKALMERFFEGYSRCLAHVDDDTITPEERVRRIISGIVNFVRENTDLALVTYNELPFDVPEIAELKAERVSSVMARLQNLIFEFGLDPADNVQKSMIGPFLPGMILNSFRVQPVLTRAFDVTMNDEYYERFIDTVTTIYLRGISGLADQSGRESPQ